MKHYLYKSSCNASTLKKIPLTRVDFIFSLELCTFKHKCKSPEISTGGGSWLWNCLLSVKRFTTVTIIAIDISVYLSISANAPVITLPGAPLSFPDSTTAGTVLHTLVVTDVDVGDTVTTSLISNTNPANLEFDAATSKTFVNLYRRYTFPL